jgi:shikimate dehydrogenase
VTATFTTLSARTRLCAVIGDPVRHSLSPIIHNAAFGACDLDWAYVALPVDATRGGDVVQAMRTFSLEGLSVTMPHKGAVFESVDATTDRASALRACNTVFRQGDQLIGDSTDGAGCIAALAEAGVRVAGSTFAVIGAGGAGRSVIAALGAAGAASIVVINRDRLRGESAAALGGLVARLAKEAPDIATSVHAADVVINASSLGMGTDDRLPSDPELMRADQLINDLIYFPVESRWLKAARAKGCTTLNGIGMLLHQATLQFELWTHLEAPIETMRAALTTELVRRAASTEPT